MLQRPNHHQLLESLLDAWPLDRWVEHRSLVAVSGGPDSVALLRALAELHPQPAGNIFVGHFNHRWRGVESDQDEAFTAQLAARLGLTFFSEQASDYLAESNRGLSGEGVARDQRYQFLQNTARAAGARYIVTAHHAGDQVETILQRIFRGTGIAGLTGIAPLRTIDESITLIRPLLAVRRETILGYLHTLSQPYRHDISNQSNDYTRNQIRNELLPLLERQFGRHVSQQLLNLCDQAVANQQVMDRLVDAFFSGTTIQFSSGKVMIQRESLRQLETHLVCEIFKKIWADSHWPQSDMTFARWRKLATAVQQADEKFQEDLPGGVHLEINASFVQLKRQA
jgi:tRNA(Ile)-lysidine synthase